MTEKIFGLAGCFENDRGMFFTEKGLPHSWDGKWGFGPNNPPIVQGADIYFMRGSGMGDSLPTVIKIEGRQPSDWNPLEWEQLANTITWDKELEAITKSWEGVFRGIRRDDTPSEQTGAIHHLRDLSWRLVFPDKLSGETVLGALRTKASLEVLREDLSTHSHSHQAAKSWEVYPQEFKDKYHSLLALEEKLRKDTLVK